MNNFCFIILCLIIILFFSYFLNIRLFIFLTFNGFFIIFSQFTNSTNSYRSFNTAPFIKILPHKSSKNLIGNKKCICILFTLRWKIGTNKNKTKYGIWIKSAKFSPTISPQTTGINNLCFFNNRISTNNINEVRDVYSSLWCNIKEL